MKNYILISIYTLVMIACTPSTTDENLKKQKDSLLTVINENETSVKDFISLINEVERNLDSVTRKQHIINTDYSKNIDVRLDKKLRINEDIKAINKLMDSNIKKLDELNTKLKTSSRKNKLLEQTIQTLKNQLEQKYFELDQLNEKLNSLNLHVTQLQTSIDSLKTENLSQLQTIVDNTKVINTAYYIVGEKKDLEKSKIIDNKGGLLGLGKTAKLNENIDKDYFTQIDYFQTTSIAINSKNMKIITTHSPDSYTLEKTGKLVNTIRITDPEKFWSASKYLVVIVN